MAYKYNLSSSIQIYIYNYIEVSITGTRARAMLYISVMTRSYAKSPPVIYSFCQQKTRYLLCNSKCALLWSDASPEVL